MPTLDHDSDTSLIQRCARGDERAWRSLVSRYAGLVYAIAREHGLPEDVCDDAAQTVFAALAQAIGSLSDDRVIASWLRTATARECWRLVRIRKRTMHAADPEAHAAVPPDPQRLADLEAHQRLRDALDELGGRCRDLLMLLFFGPADSAYDRAERELSIPRGSIGPTRRRCLAKLADILGPVLGER